MLAPKLRFPQFTDDWKQYKLGDNSEIIAGGTPNTSHSEYWNPKEIPWMSSGEINNKVIYATNDMISKIGFSKSSAKWVKEKSVLIALAGQGKTRGTVAITEIPLTTNQSIAAIQPNNSLYYKFIFQNLEGRYEELRSISSGDETRGGLNKQILSDFKMLVPTISEQKKIGDFLCAIDHLITLHQHKYDALLEYKQGMLQKMFPKEGEKVPEIRFPGFEGDWKKCKLGEIADIVGGGTPSTNISAYWDGDIDWYTPAEISNEIYLNSSQRKITKKGYENSSAKILPVGTVLFTSRAGIGKAAILNKESCTNQGFQSIIPSKDKLDSYFIFSRIKELKKYAETVGSGSTFIEVSGKQMENMELIIPKTIEEQKIIGDFFKNIDNLIVLQQKKLEQIKKYKKGLLQQMFI